MKNWLIALCIRSDQDALDYMDMITERVNAEWGKYYKDVFYYDDIKTSFDEPWVGQVHYLYFNVPAQSEQAAIEFIGGWATEVYCRPPDLVHRIDCLGEYSDELFQQAMAG